MFYFFHDCERQGPPLADDSDEHGNLTVAGPNGQRVYFRRFDNPGGDPRGYMYVMKIG